MLIDWKDAAKADAAVILSYIAQDNISAAYDVYEEIRQQVSILAQFPKLGRKGRVSGSRELVITGTPYIVAYRIKGEAVHILRILHGAQNWPRKL